MTETAERASRAADILHLVATAVFVVMTIVAVAAVGGGLALLAISDTNAQRISAAVIAGAGAVSWPLSILPCVAAQALARYIEFRIDES